MNYLETDRTSPSTPPSTNVLSTSADSTIVEQQARRIEALEAELERIRQAADADLANWTTKYTGLMRENTTLHNKLVRQEEDEPEHDEVRELLLVWKDVTNRQPRTDIGAGGKRYALVKAAHKRWGQKRCEHALRGLGLQQWAGPRGRSPVEYPGAKKYNDVEHALGDEVRMEKLEAIWLAHQTPTLLDQPEPEPAKPHLAVVPEPRRRRAIAWPERPPIDKVLEALHDRDCQVRAHDSQPDNWSANCPAHDDHDPSLSVHRKPDGMVLLHCWAGCLTEDVVGALRLEFSDLWTNSERDHGREFAPNTPRPLPGHLKQAMRHLLARDDQEAA